MLFVVGGFLDRVHVESYRTENSSIILSCGQDGIINPVDLASGKTSRCIEIFAYGLCLNLFYFDESSCREAFCKKLNCLLFRVDLAADSRREMEAEDKESLAALAKESTQKNESFGQTFNEAARDPSVIFRHNNFLFCTTWIPLQLLVYKNEFHRDV